jgi:mono/diheme cytochrome c family protein
MFNLDHYCWSRHPMMSLKRTLHVILAVALALLVLMFIRMHLAAAQAPGVQGPGVQAPGVQAPGGDAEAGRLSTQAWCTECHSVQLETAGTGRFAPDFTVIAKRRSARWLHAFLRRKHTLMPDFVFNRTEADDVVAYIVSLKRN